MPSTASSVVRAARRPRLNDLRISSTLIAGPASVPIKKSWPITCPCAIDFGDGVHSRGVNSSASKSFFRLHCVDFPGITSVDEARYADFDGDGLSNIFEVSFGFDPFDAASSASVNEVDADGDGLTNGTEHSQGLNPALKDHPVVQLDVSAD